MCQNKASLAECNSREQVEEPASGLTISFRKHGKRKKKKKKNPTLYLREAIENQADRSSIVFFELVI